MWNMDERGLYRFIGNDERSECRWLGDRSLIRDSSRPSDRHPCGIRGRMILAMRCFDHTGMAPTFQIIVQVVHCEIPIISRCSSLPGRYFDHRIAKFDHAGFRLM